MSNKETDPSDPIKLPERCNIVSDQENEAFGTLHHALLKIWWIMQKQSDRTEDEQIGMESFPSSFQNKKNLNSCVRE